MQILCGLQVVFFLFNCQTPEQLEHPGSVVDASHVKIQDLGDFDDLEEAAARKK